MSVATKNKRKLVYKDIVYYWCVYQDWDSCGQLILNVMSEDKALFLTYPIGEVVPYVVSKGRFFQGKETNGCWNRYLLPFEGEEVITPKFVAKLIAFATEGTEAVEYGVKGMYIRKCTPDDVGTLAVLNKQLIEDEKSDNPMTAAELEERMRGFLETDYDAYFFVENREVMGYALVNKARKPMYLRQFMIERKYRKQHNGTKAFHMLLNYLKVKELEVEVLPWNEAGLAFWESCGFREVSRYMRLKGE